MHTYFEVQLTAPGVTSYGAVWVGFPVLRQCFTEYLGWTQTTNNPAESDLYRLTLKDGGYVLDGQVEQFESRSEVIKVQERRRIAARRAADGAADRARSGRGGARRRDRSRCAWPRIDRPRLFEQFWRMGLAHNLDGMAGGDAHAAAAALQHRLRRSRRSHRLRLQRDAAGALRPATIASGRASCPAIDPTSSSSTIVPTTRCRRSSIRRRGWVQNSQRHAVDVGVSDAARLDEVRAGFAAPQGITQRAQRGIRILSAAPAEDDVRRRQGGEAVDARRDRRSVRGRPRRDGAKARAPTARSARPTCSRSGIGRRRRTATARCSSTSSCSGGRGFRVDRRLRGADRRSPAARRRRADSRTRPRRWRRSTRWPARSRRSTARCTCSGATCCASAAATLDVPGNGAPSQLGAIRTIDSSPFENGKAEGVQRRHVLRGHRVLDAAARRGAAQLRQLVEEGLAARRGSDAADVAQGDAADVARPQGRRGEPREPESVLAGLRPSEASGRRIRNYFLTGRYGPSAVALGPASRRFRLAGVLVWPPAHSTALAISVCIGGRRNVG